MLQHIPPDDDSDDDVYVRQDAHRQPLPRRRWTRTEWDVPLGTVSVVVSVVCLLTPIVMCFIAMAPLQPTIDSPPVSGSIAKLLDRFGWMPSTMPWVCVVSAFLGLYAYFKSGDVDDKTGLVGALVGGVAFLAWVVVRIMWRGDYGSIT